MRAASTPLRFTTPSGEDTSGDIGEDASGDIGEEGDIGEKEASGEPMGGGEKRRSALSTGCVRLLGISATGCV